MHCRLGPQGSKVVSEGINSNNSLRVLEVAHNGILDAGCIALSAMLADNTCLAVLDLSDNSIGSAACHTLARMLERNNTIQALILNNNPLGVNGGASVIQALASSSSLTHIGLQV